jgi:archaellum biogenesis ATPase FlaH
MKYIVSPLLIEKISDIDLLGNDLLNYDGLNFLIGKAKVGKTAFAYKLMHWLVVQEKHQIPYFITGGKKRVYQYWDAKFCQLYIPESTFILFEGIKRIFYANTKNWEGRDSAKIILLALFGNEIKTSTDSIIILDDIDSIINDSNIAYIRLLVSQLNKLRVENQAKILLTGRSRNKIERIMDLITVEQPGKFVYRYLTLERPAFIEGDIKEFGECRVWVKEKK